LAISSSAYYPPSRQLSAAQGNLTNCLSTLTLPFKLFDSSALSLMVRRLSMVPISLSYITPQAGGDGGGGPRAAGDDGRAHQRRRLHVHTQQLAGAAGVGGGGVRAGPAHHLPHGQPRRRGPGAGCGPFESRFRHFVRGRGCTASTGLYVQASPARRCVVGCTC
jgi:hypothetical protein